MLLSWPKCSTTKLLVWALSLFLSAEILDNPLEKAEILDSYVKTADNNAEILDHLVEMFDSEAVILDKEAELFDIPSEKLDTKQSRTPFRLLEIVRRR